MPDSKKITIDHEEIKSWVESNGGHPARVRDVQGDLLRIEFPGFSGKDSLEPISWEEFFRHFESNNLAFQYQDKEGSRFNKLIERE